MTEAGWLTIVGLLVTVALAVATAVFGLIGWLLSRMIGSQDKAIRDLQVTVSKIANDNVRIKTLMEDHDWIAPHRLRFPSPPPMEETG